MTENSTAKQSKTVSESNRIKDTYYSLLGLHPSASVLEIRRTYRRLSKQYHPDTTNLPLSVAKLEFQKINEAYGVLSSPERRSLYDLKIGYSRINVIQAPQGWESPLKESSSAYLDPVDRPLSSGEIFVLFLLGFTFCGCILLAVAIAYLRI